MACVASVRACGVTGGPEALAVTAVAFSFILHDELCSVCEAPNAFRLRQLLVTVQRVHHKGDDVCGVITVSSGHSCRRMVQAGPGRRGTYPRAWSTSRDSQNHAVIAVFVL